MTMEVRSATKYRPTLTPSPTEVAPRSTDLDCAVVEHSIEAAKAAGGRVLAEGEGSATEKAPYNLAAMVVQVDDDNALERSRHHVRPGR